MTGYGAQKKRLNIPLYDIGTVAAGFYIGYAEGKGLDVGPTVEYFTKYGPTVFAIIYTPLMLKTINSFNRWINRKTLQGLGNGELEVHQKGFLKKYKDLNNSEREEIFSKIMKNSYNLESRIKDQKYLKPTLIAGARTAIETAIGYTAGRLYSQIN